MKILVVADPFVPVIVVPEALACGIPVIAARRASTPEVIQDSMTGFLCDSEDEMVDAVHRISEIDRAQCRNAAEQRVSKETIGQRCLALIEQVLQAK